MGLFNRIKRSKPKEDLVTSGFKFLTTYSPVFSTYDGGVYELELTRSAINTIATHCSKLNPVIIGSNQQKKLSKILQSKPNYLMTTQQFLQRLITIYLCENNAFIIPIYDNIYCDRIVGLYPVRGAGARIVRENNIDYLIYVVDGTKYCIEYERVGHLKNHLYKHEYQGESNIPLNTTIDLIHTQDEGIKEGIKAGAMIRFIARIATIQKPKDLKEEQKRLKEENLSMDNSGGFLILDNKYNDVKQVDSKPFIVDDKQSSMIKQNVFNYFHVAEEIIQNKATEDQWNSFYEGCIEPIAIQLGQVLTNMLMNEHELEKGYNVVFESTKLQFASNATKLSVSQQLFDRGILSINQVMDIWNLPHVDGGDERYIRKEYTNINNLDSKSSSDKNIDIKEEQSKGEGGEKDGEQEESIS